MIRTAQNQSKQAVILPRVALHRFAYFQDDANIPLIDVPKRLHFSLSGSGAYVFETRTTVSARGEEIPIATDKYEALCPNADRILNEYIQKAYPIKNTIKWMDYGSEKSGTKVGAGSEKGYEVGIKIDIGELLNKAFAGEADAKFMEKWQIAYAFYIEQAKKYLLAIRLGRLNEQYQTDLIGLEIVWIKGSITSQLKHANEWLQTANDLMDKKLNTHFEQLIKITGN